VAVSTDGFQIGVQCLAEGFIAGFSAQGLGWLLPPDGPSPPYPLPSAVRQASGGARFLGSFVVK
jgi:hypothetical protein